LFALVDDDNNILTNELLLEVSLPNSIKYITTQTFAYCTNLEYVSFSENIVSIEQGAFFECKSLDNVELPDTLLTIGNSCFQNCINLKNIKLNSINEIGILSFQLTSIEEIIFPNTLKTINTGAFNNCPITKAVLPTQAIQYIPKDKLQEVVITSGKEINGVFLGCSSLKSVIIGDSVMSIGDAAFHSCTNLTSVVIGDSVTSIGDSAFIDCDSLTSITIPGSVTTIGGSAFAQCNSLKSVVICNGVETIGRHAFYYCESLTSIVLPDSVTNIGESVFDLCSSLTSIEFGRGIVDVASVCLPASVQEVTFKNTIQTFNANWLPSDTNIKSIYIPRGSKASFETALSGTTACDIAVACLIDTADYATKELVNEVVSGMHRQIAWDDPAIFNTDLSGRTISFDTTVNGYFGLSEAGFSGTGKIYFESSGGYQLVLHMGPPDIFFGKKLGGDRWSDQILLWDYENSGVWVTPVLSLPADFGKITVIGNIDSDSEYSPYGVISTENAIAVLKILAPNGIDELSHVNLTGDQILQGTKTWRAYDESAGTKFNIDAEVSPYGIDVKYGSDSVHTKMSYNSVKVQANQTATAMTNSGFTATINDVDYSLKLPAEHGTIATQSWIETYIANNFATLMATYLESHAATFAEVDPDDEFEVEEPTEPAVTE
jgi:hypothetical protein